MNWNPTWICPANDLGDPAAVFGTSFVFEKKITHANLTITAMGVYEARLNGRRVGQFVMAPGWTSYHKRLQYQEYDITDLLTNGKNEIEVTVGKGWYRSPLPGWLGCAYQDELRSRPCGLAAQITLTFEDGSSKILSTDKSWKVSDGPVRFSEIYDGEIYDSAKTPLLDQPVTIFDGPTDTLILQQGEEVCEQERLAVKKVFVTPNGEAVLDFGQNMTGYVELFVNAKAGDCVDLSFAEVMDKEGNFYTENYRGAKAQYHYICSDGVQTWHPSLTFYGFRYIRINDFPGGIDCVKPENFTAITVHSNMKRTGFLSSSNTLLNQLFSNIIWGQKGNFLDVPTDCPQRDERLGWTGDAQIFCRTATYLMNTYTFYKKWLHDLEVDQTPEGGVPHVVPNIEEGRTDGNWLLRQGPHSAAAWADAAIINPWTMYLMYGDKDILKKQYNSMKGWIDFMRAHAVDYIWNYKLQFGDWVALDAEEGSYFGATPNDLTCTAYYAYSTGLFVQMAKALGKEDVAAEYEELYHKIVKKFQETFFDAEGNMTAQTQTAHIVALYFQLTPEKYITKTVEGLKRLLDKENGHLVTGFVGTPYFCHALSQNHSLKEAYDLLLKEDFPSWLYQVKKGATTIWEHWDGMKDDGSMWSADMNSFNHYAYGAIGEWMYRVMAGIEADPEYPGFKHAILYPRIGGNLKYTAGKYHSIYGDVGVKWEVQGKQITLTVQIPVNTTAEIRLDQAKAVLESDGLTFAREADYMAAEAGSGTYHIAFEQ